jgi:hypothetical protein
LQSLLAAQSRHAEAEALLDSVRSGISAAYVLYVIDALAGSPMELKALETQSLARSLFGDYYDSPSGQLRWLMGVWHARDRDVPRVQRILAGLDSLAQESGSRRNRLLAEALACHLALARGDTTEAIWRLRTLRPTARRDSLKSDLAEPLAIERMLLAELLLARGAYQEAHDVAAIFDHPAPTIFLPFLPRSLTIRLRAAEYMDREDLAAHYRHRLQSLGGV